MSLFSLYFTKVISKNYICGNNNIFSLDNGITKVKSIENTSNLLVGESDKYIVEGYGNKLYAYNKRTGKQARKAERKYYTVLEFKILMMALAIVVASSSVFCLPKETRIVPRAYSSGR